MVQFSNSYFDDFTSSSAAIFIRDGLSGAANDKFFMARKMAH